MDTKYNQSYKTECEQPNVEIRPNDTIIFELMPSNKKIYGKVEIHNRTLQDQMYRIKTTAPDYYIFRYHKDEAIPPSGIIIIEIELICDESRLQHRLKDKFLIEIVEKQKYEAAPSEDCRWKQPFKNIKLGMSMMRKDLISSQTSLLRKSQGQINSYFAQSKILCGAPQILTTVINQDESISEESRGIKLKLESLKQKFQEQAKLIEQYKFDINELQNEIDRNSFIYDLEKKNDELQPEENIVNTLRDKTGIPLWELFLAATIAVILGALLNKQ